MQARQVDIEMLRPWIEASFSRAGGPGGQNVNKVNTRVTLLFDLDQCDLLTDAQRQRIRTRLRARLARDGRLQVISQTARTQPANRALAEQRLVDLVRQALIVPKTRRPTAPTRASQRRRVDDKRQRGEQKRLRRPPSRD